MTNSSRDVSLMLRNFLAIVSAVLFIPLSGFASTANDFTPGASARADFNGDGTPDLLLRHDDGRWHLYSLDGSTVLSSNSVRATRNTAWVPISLADSTLTVTPISCCGVTMAAGGCIP